MLFRSFLSLVQRLPPRWQDLCRQRKIDARELAQERHGETLSKKTYEDTYVASLRIFLRDSIAQLQDQGFPTTLTVDGLAYVGERAGAENKQRAFRPEELKRLFEGEEMRSFANDPKLVQRFWLPHLGLFTGARVNELCQINPQTDVQTDPATGISYLLLTEGKEADPEIVKTIKTGVTRVVPVHDSLLKLGFLEYVNVLKSHGATRLFPDWKPRDKRASPNAIKWFSRFLDEIGLRGVANESGKALRGTHAFRHTLLTYGKLHPDRLNLRCITGHKEPSSNPVADGYEDETMLETLADKAALLNRLTFEIDFATPVLPSLV